MADELLMKLDKASLLGMPLCSEAADYIRALVREIDRLKSGAVEARQGGGKGAFRSSSSPSHTDDGKIVNYEWVDLSPELIDQCGSSPAESASGEIRTLTLISRNEDPGSSSINRMLT